MTSATVNGVTSTYVYRPDNLRVTKTVGGVFTRHVWDMDNIVMDLDGSYGIVGEYTRGVALIDYSPDGTERWHYTLNNHGDVSGMMSDDGTDSVDYDYDAYGNQAEITATDTNPFRYSGEYYDYETGFIYLRNRYYDTTTGRFTTEDPVRDGLNWYAYCAGNPLKYVDPNGLEIILRGSYNDRISLLSEMQKITNYTLYIEAIEDSQGQLVHYVRMGKKTQNLKHDLTPGNTLVSELISSDKYTSIGYGLSGTGKDGTFTPYSAENATNGVGTGGVIYVNRDPQSTFLVQDSDGRVYNDTPDVYMTLAHEMIHAHHSIHGRMTPATTTNIGFDGLYEFRNIDGNLSNSSLWQEELNTVGIAYEKKDRNGNLTGVRMSQLAIETIHKSVTENAIRASLGLPKRITY